MITIIPAAANTGTGSATGTNSHAEGSNTLASGANAHAEGAGATASGQAAHAEGSNTLASGTGSHAEGDSTQATGRAAHCSGGETLASGDYSTASGFRAVAARYGQHAQASFSRGAAGDAQVNWFTAGAVTTDATPTLATFTDAPAAVLTGSATNVLTLLANRACRFRIDVVARRSDVSGDAAGWEFKGLISRADTGPAVIATPLDAMAWTTAGAGAWDVTVSVDTSGAENFLAVTVTGEAAKTIRWIASITTTEVG